MAETPNFTLKGGPYSDYVPSAPPPPNALAVRGPRDLVDVTPAKLKSGLPWGKILGGTTAAGLLGYSFLGPSENDELPPIPMRLPGEEAIPEEPQNAGSGKATVAAKASVPSRKLASGASKAQAEIPMALNFGDGFKDTAQALEGAQERENLAILANQLGRAGSLAGAAIAGVQPGDLSGYDTNIKLAGRITAQHKERMEKEKNDPNSPLSKGMKQFMRSFGFNVQGDATAEELMKLSPLAERYFNAMENRELRREQMAQQMLAAQLRREEIKANKEIALGQKETARVDKFVESAQKRIGEEYGKLQKVQSALDQIEAAAGDEIGPSDVAILYNFIKTMDPESVVREGEIALGKQGQALAGKLYTATLGQLRGELLDKNFRKGVLTIARRLAERGGKDYNDAVQSIRDTGTKRYGMSEEDLTLIDPMLNKQAREKKAEPPPNKSTIDLIESRSDEENSQRLEELRKKYRGT